MNLPLPVVLAHSRLTMEKIDLNDIVIPESAALAYAAQDHGELIIEKYSGSFTNIVGLPMSEVKEALAHSFNTFPAT